MKLPEPYSPSFSRGANGDSIYWFLVQHSDFFPKSRGLLPGPVQLNAHFNTPKQLLYPPVSTCLY